MVNHLVLSTCVLFTLAASARGSYVIDAYSAPVDQLPCNWFFGAGPGGATFGGQTFTAPSGLLDTLTVGIRNDWTYTTPDLHFRLLIAEAFGNTPTDVIFQSDPLFISANTGAVNVTADLHDLDLKDGRTYAWILDATPDFQGTPMAGFIVARLYNGPDFDGGCLVSLLDYSKKQQPGWGFASDLDFVYRLTYEDGGEQDPEHASLRDIRNVGTPEPSSLVLLSLGAVGIVGAAIRRRLI